MAFTVGIFDLFCFVVPGALQLAILVYVLDRAGWAEFSAIDAQPTVLVVAGGLVASYLLGRLCHPLGAQLERLLPRWSVGPDVARQEFLARVPQARNRPYVHADPALLLAAAETHDRDAAGEIGTMRAQSLMLRNVALALALALLVALAELVVGKDRPLAGASAALLLITATSTMRQGRKLWHVSRLKTLEICFWLPDIDAKLTSEGRPSAQPE